MAEATARPLAYKITSTVEGTIIVGDLAIGENAGPWSGNPGGKKWYNSPDLDLSYVIAKGVSGGGQPVPAGVTPEAGGAYLGFWGTRGNKTEGAFLSLAGYVRRKHTGVPYTFSTGDEATLWLNNAGYWTSFSPVHTTHLKLHLDAANLASYDGTGSTWYDLTAHDHNAILYNTPTYDAAGWLSFDAASYEYALAPNLGNLSKYTVEAWFRYTGNLGSPHVTSIVTNEFDGNDLNFSIGTNNAPGSQELTTGFFNRAWRNTNGVSTSSNTWYQMVGSFDGNTVKTYLNGVEEAALSYSGTPKSGGGVRIARRWDAAANDQFNYFPGDISIVRIYSEALSDVEIDENFQAQRGRYEI
jgi:hypothetical protein